MRAPLLAMLAVAAVLLVPASASAAMGGANPGVGSQTPNLRTANVQSLDPVAATATVRYCFDKPIGSTPVRDRFLIGTYNQHELGGEPPSEGNPGTLADQVTRVGTSCADAVFSNDFDPADPADTSFAIDIGEFTYATVFGGGVINASLPVTNNSDSTALIGSNTHSGTANHYVGPTLVGLTVNNLTSTATFTFDKNVAGTQEPGDCIRQEAETCAYDTQNFQLEDINGNLIPSKAGSGDIQFSGNAVNVKFNAGTTNTAVRGVIEEEVVRGIAQNAVNVTHQAVAKSGSSGNTNLPDLISSQLALDGSYIDFTYDENVVVSDRPACRVGDSARSQLSITGGREAFRVVLANGDDVDVNCDPLTVVSGNTVRWRPNKAFPAPGDSTEYNEFIVQAVVERDAVTATNGGRKSSEGMAPLGGNQGAFATGFTTGPEALRVTFDKPNNTANVLLDQRFQLGDQNDFNLIDDTGNVLPFSPISVSGAGGPASQVTAKVTFNAGDLNGARSIQLADGAVEGNGFVDAFDPGSAGSGNVDQILSPTAPAVLTRRHGRVVWHKVNVRRAHTKKAKRVTRRSRRHR